MLDCHEGVADGLVCGKLLQSSECRALDVDEEVFGLDDKGRTKSHEIDPAKKEDELNDTNRMNRGEIDSCHDKE